MSIVAHTCFCLNHVDNGSLRRACEAKDLVLFHVERDMPDHFEVLVIEQVLDIATRPVKKLSMQRTKAPRVRRPPRHANRETRALT